MKGYKWEEDELNTENIMEGYRPYRQSTLGKVIDLFCYCFTSFYGGYLLSGWLIKLFS